MRLEQAQRLDAEHDVLMPVHGDHRVVHAQRLARAIETGDRRKAAAAPEEAQQTPGHEHREAVHEQTCTGQPALPAREPAVQRVAQLLLFGRSRLLAHADGSSDRISMASGRVRDARQATADDPRSSDTRW